MTQKQTNHLPLRERVAARKRGDDAPKMTREERDKRDNLFLTATTMQVLGLIALIGYAWWEWERGFQTLNILLVLSLSALFLIGRGIHIYLSVSKKRRR